MVERLSPWTSPALSNEEAGLIPVGGRDAGCDQAPDDAMKDLDRADRLQWRADYSVRLSNAVSRERPTGPRDCREFRTEHRRKNGASAGLDANRCCRGPAFSFVLYQPALIRSEDFGQCCAGVPERPRGGDPSHRPVLVGDEPALIGVETGRSAALKPHPWVWQAQQKRAGHHVEVPHLDRRIVSVADPQVSHRHWVSHPG